MVACTSALVAATHTLAHTQLTHLVHRRRAHGDQTTTLCAVHRGCVVASRSRCSQTPYIFNVNSPACCMLLAGSSWQPIRALERIHTHTHTYSRAHKYKAVSDSARVARARSKSYSKFGGKSLIKIYPQIPLCSHRGLKVRATAKTKPQLKVLLLVNITYTHTHTAPRSPFVRHRLRGSASKVSWSMSGRFRAYSDCSCGHA